MKTLIIEDKSIQLNDQGFLIDLHMWSEAVTMALAKMQNVELTEDHWKLIYFLRSFYQDHAIIPPLRIFIKAVNAELGPELGNSLRIHTLFPDSPLKLIAQLAGLPKPKHCL